MVMHIRDGAATTDPGVVDKFKQEERTRGGKQTFFFCRNLVDNLSRREEVLAYFIFWVGGFFYIRFYLFWFDSVQVKTSSSKAGNK